MISVGFVLLVASACATFFNLRVDPAVRPPLWRKFRRLGWGLGTILGVASIFMFFPVTGTDGLRYSVHGVPFPAYEFDEKGNDYVSPMSMPFVLLNILFWLLLPQFVLWVTSGHRRREEAPRAVVGVTPSQESTTSLGPQGDTGSVTGP
jgi:hypothetical protein